MIEVGFDTIWRTLRNYRLNLLIKKSMRLIRQSV